MNISNMYIYMILVRQPNGEYDWSRNENKLRTYTIYNNAKRFAKRLHDGEEYHVIKMTGQVVE